ncbi:putative reverse transcriptase domain-containing protein [Tanacetum coccineum]
MCAFVRLFGLPLPDSPDEISSPEHISPLPAISPFLCIDSSEAPDSSDGPPSQDPYVMTVARWRSKVASRPSSSSEFPIAPVTAPPWIYQRSSSDSSPVHSSGLYALDQAHSGSSTRDVSPRLGYPLRKLCFQNINDEPSLRAFEPLKIPWSNVKAMMTTEYCPATEIQRMEQELWTLTLKGDDIEAYKFQKEGTSPLQKPATLQMRQSNMARNWSSNPFSGHFKDKCPKAGNQQNDGARGRAYVVIENPQQNPNVVTATLNTSYEIELADGKVVSTNTILRSCTLVLLNHVFKIDLLPTRLGSFDVIIGMDWLAYHRALIDCYEKIVRIPLPNCKILEVQGERPENDLGSLICIKADEKKLDDIRVVRDFPEVFLDDLLGLPLVREIEFRIDLIPGASPSEASKDLKAPTKWLRGLERHFEHEMMVEISSLIVSDSSFGANLDIGGLYEEETLLSTLADVLTCSKLKAENIKHPQDILQQPEIPAEMEKSAHFLPIREDYKTEKLAKIYVNEIVARPVVPRSIISKTVKVDSVTPLANFQKALGTRLDMSTAYHPQTDGQSERTIQTLEDMLRACVMDFGGS